MIADRTKRRRHHVLFRKSASQKCAALSGLLALGRIVPSCSWLRRVVVRADANLRESTVHGDAVELATASSQVVDLALTAVHVLEALLLEASLERAGEFLARMPLIDLHRKQVKIS